MPRRYDSADAKRRILTACVRFFLEKGYTRTTVAEIVKEADVSISTFQNVFRTKDGALLADVLLRPAQPVYLPRYFPQTAASGKPGTALK